MDDVDARFVGAPEPPYFLALATTSVSGPPERAAAFMAEIYRQAALTPGFLGAEKAREPTGNGLPGRQPVLKGKVQKWLAQCAEVMAFAQATGPQGGAGALVVLLSGS